MTNDSHTADCWSAAGYEDKRTAENRLCKHRYCQFSYYCVRRKAENELWTHKVRNLGMWLKLEMGMVLILLLFSVLWRRIKEVIKNI